MSKDTLAVAGGLRLDADYTGGGTFALLAKKGAGKTYASRVMAEEFWQAGIPFVGLDPMGAMWGLRSSADGKSAGIPVAIFGGHHGDAPLERTSGALMADLVVDDGLSMVLDMSELGSRAAERQFAQDFLERLYRRNSDLVHLLIDEADLFAPQSPQAGDRPLLGVTENIVRRGRNRGIGVTLITQRPAVLNKDVLTQVDGLVVMRMTGLTDRKAIDEWVKGHGDDDQAREVKETLSSLANGESWWWVPELGILKRVQIRTSRTFDSSPTKKRGDKRREPKGYADVDLGTIQEKMAATIERAKATDPRELTKTIAELRRKVDQLQRDLEQRPAETERVEIEVQVPTPYVPDEVLELLSRVEKAAAAFDVIAGDAQTLHAELLDRNDGTSPHPPIKTATPAPLRPIAGPADDARAAIHLPRNNLRPIKDLAQQADGAVNAPRQKILDTIAWFEAIGVAAPKRGAVGPLAGTTATSSGFEKNLSVLRTAGLIDYPASGHLGLTATGRAIAVAPPGAPTQAELQSAVLSKLNAPRQAILAALIDAYPDALDRETLAAHASRHAGRDVSPNSSGFEKNLSSMRTLELLDYPQQGYVRAADLLFIEGAR